MSSEPQPPVINPWDWALRIGLLVSAGFLTWNSTILIELQKKQAEIDKRTAIIESTRYSPRDRLADLQAETARFDSITLRIDALTGVIAKFAGDLQEIKAILARMEKQP